MLSDIWENMDWKQEARIVKQIMDIGQTLAQQSSQKSKLCIMNVIYLHLIAAGHCMPTGLETDSSAEFEIRLINDPSFVNFWEELDINHGLYKTCFLFIYLFFSL